MRAGVTARPHQVEGAQILKPEKHSAAAWSGLSFPTAEGIEQKINTSTADNAAQWLFLGLNAFFASCEQQENPSLRARSSPCAPANSKGGMPEHGEQDPGVIIIITR